jgi:hypothetical protein
MFWNLAQAESRTPPLCIRLFILISYLYTSLLAIQCCPNIFTAPEELLYKANLSKKCLFSLIRTYLIDVVFAVSPLHWCSMRSILPLNVAKHHVPFILV